MAAYGVDVLAPEVTPRRVAALMSGLPPWARNTGEQWSTEAYLLAALVDAVGALTWVTIKAHSKKGAVVPQPRPVPRPDGTGPGARGGKRDVYPETDGGPGAAGGVKTASWAEAAALLAGVPGMTVEGPAEGPADGD